MGQDCETVELLVCTRCRSQDEDRGGTEPAGAVLFRDLHAAEPGGVKVTPVECLSNCSNGCTVALRGPRRWTYVYGRFDPQIHVETVLEGALKYAGAPDGLVPWRERPEHFRKNCIARVPPLDFPSSSQQES